MLMSGCLEHCVILTPNTESIIVAEVCHTVFSINKVYNTEVTEKSGNKFFC